MNDDKYNITVFPGVYPPSEDTYLLLDALEIRPNDVFLEVGCGSGLITVAVVERTHNAVSIDLSIEAVRNTLENLRRNDLNNYCHVVVSDLFDAISPIAKFSLIVFNPPYLPQDDNHTDLDLALIGGFTGIELAQRFVRQVKKYLVPGGRIFLVVSNLTDIEIVQKTMTECGFVVETVSEMFLFFEKIQVLRGIL